MPVVVGVSGGPDSVCLLHALGRFAVSWHLQLYVAHLDHGLRPESAADAAFVAQLAAAWSLPCHSRRLAPGQLAGHPGGVEEAARQARYTFLWEVAQQVTPMSHVPTIVLAHHADDQAETVLMHLIRGSGLAGLAGMRWVSVLDPLDATDTRLGRFPHQREPQRAPRSAHIVRPLLNVRRTQIVRYLHAHRLTWREDASNRDVALLRNRLRYTVAPQLATLNPNWVESLGRVAHILAAEADRVRRWDRQALAELLIDPPTWPEPTDAPPTRVVLVLEGWLQLDPASQRGVLRQALALLAPGEEVGFDRIESLLWALRQDQQAQGPHPLVGALAWTVADRQLSLHRVGTLPFQPDHPFLDESWRRQYARLPVPTPGRLGGLCGWQLRAEVLAAVDLPADWRSRGRPWHAFLDADRVAAPVLATPRPGLRFAPLGMGGQHKSVGDLFTDHKVAAALRDGWPLIVDGGSGEVVWVCGIRPAHGARITAGSRRVLHLRWEREP